MNTLPANPTESASRTVPCWLGSKMIGSAPSGSVPIKFDYQWDLREIEDAKGGKFRFLYQQVYRTVDGYSYCGESYIKTIKSDNNQELRFETIDKPIEERRPLKELIDGDFDFDATKLLSKLKKVDITRSEETLLKYIHALNAGIQGYQKPQLGSITSSERISNNFRLEYSTGELLGRLVNTKTGASTVYTYSLRDIHLSQLDTFKIGLQTANFNTTKVLNMGDHIFCIDTGNGSATKFEIIDYSGNRFQQAYISGVTGVALQNTRCFPGSGYFVLVKAIVNDGDTANHELKLYEYIDKRWVLSNGFGNSGVKTFPFRHKTVAYTSGNILIINDLIESFQGRPWRYVFKKINGRWESIFNAVSPALHDQDGNGSNSGDYPGWQTRPSVYGFGLEEPSHSYDPEFRWIGDCWEVETPFFAERGRELFNYKKEKLENHFITFVYNSIMLFRYDISKYNNVFRYDNSYSPPGIYYSGDESKWQKMVFTGSNNLPVGTKAYFGKNYFITIEPDNWMMIGRYRATDHENFQPTFIAPVNGIDPTATDLNHKWGFDTPRPYAKVFDYPIDEVYCQDDYFVALNRSNRFVWVFRWNNQINKWESKINCSYQGIVTGCEWDDATTDWRHWSVVKDLYISVADSKGQGFKFDYPIKDMYLTDDKIGIWYFNSIAADSVLAIASYDRLRGRYGENWPVEFEISYPVSQQKKKIQLIDGALYELCEGNGTQTFRIISSIKSPCKPYTNLFTYWPSTYVVSSVKESGGIGKDITTEYTYNEDLELDAFHKDDGIPFFRKVTTKINNANNGSITNTFECDSSNGLFGALLERVTKNNNNSVVSSVRSFRDVHTINLPNQRIVTVPRLLKEEKNGFGTVSNTIWPAEHFLGDITTGNGQPAIYYTTNSNGHALVKKTIFAYNCNAADTRMSVKNMRKQVAGEIQYDVENIINNWKSDAQRNISTQQAINLSFTSMALRNEDQFQCSFLIKKDGFLVIPSIVIVALRFNYQNGSNTVVASKTVTALHLNRVLLSHTIVSSDNPSTINSIDLLITPIFNNVIVKNIDADIIKDLDNDVDAIAGSATTWDWFNNKCLPKSSYAWNVPMGSNGRPATGYSFQPFNYQNISANAKWNLLSTVEKYDIFSVPVENKNGKSISSSVIYRNDINLPVGSIANSKYDEAAIFTCDYDKNESGFFDAPNKWLHYNNTTLPSGAVCAIQNATPSHFGEKCLHVKNCQAAAKTITVHSKTAKITWSSWVRPIDDKPIRFAASLVENGVGNHNVFYDYEYNTSNGLKKDGIWQFVKFSIDITKPVGGTLPTSFDGKPDAQGNEDGIYVWVGNYEHKPASDFYIEDIRIYPAKSLVTTTYYDSKWQQPILTVDANGNPSKKVEYDEFGRPVRWYKINKTTADLTLLQQKEYHLMGDFSNPNPNQWYKIVPDVDESFCIDVEGSTCDDDGQNIHLMTYSEAASQLWQFEATDDGYYYVVNKECPTSYIDDPNGVIDEGTQLKIYPWKSDNQKWKLTDAGEGFCRISAKASDAAFIDLANGNAANGSKLQIWPSGTNNRWKLVLME
jgi:hypothetical protein